jgi:hypothetical protein
MTISATKPTDIPRWASVAPGTSRTAPLTSQQDNGWGDGERPAAEVQNWLQGVLYDWQQYLEDATDQLETSKINKTGATDLSGTFQPTVNNGASLGVTGNRFNNGFFTTLTATTGAFVNASVSTSLTAASLTPSRLISPLTTKTISGAGTNQAIGVGSDLAPVFVVNNATATIRELTGLTLGQLLIVTCAADSANSLLLVDTNFTGLATAGRMVLNGATANVEILQNNFILLIALTHPVSGVLYWRELFRSP